jgi:cobalt transporter subunit CbtA
MFRNLFFAAVLAALCAGLVNAGIQHFRVTPLILAAEVYENAAPEEHAHAEGTEAHSHEATEAAAPAGHDHGADEWAPQDGFERTAYTVLADLLVAAGFALVIGGVSMIANIPITFRNGALWGLAGFLVFSLAPAYGLAPELPGMPAADLGARQIWWIATVLATGGAILLIVKVRAPWALAVAIVLAALPHVIGAPQLVGEHESGVPANLATEFAAAALGTAAIFWLVLGASFGRLNDYFASRKAI